MFTQLTKQQVDKIGNTIVYLSGVVSELNKTKILKLLFFLEEYSIKQYGYPFFGVDFKVWVRGPVLEDIYNDLERKNIDLLNPFIKRAHYDEDLFIANAAFNDDEFSDNDMKSLNAISNLAKHKNASDLVRISHEEGSLWAETARRCGVYDDLIREHKTKTEHLIDFSLLVDKDEFLRERFENAKENLDVINSLK